MGTRIVYIKIIRTDFAKAFLTKEVRQYIGSRGIQHQGAAPNEHFQLGISEKHNQDADNTMIKTMESSGYAKSRPKLWAEVSAANEFIYNVMPKKRHKWLSNLQMYLQLRPFSDHW